MKTVPLPPQPDTNSPAGSEVRSLMEADTGTMIHCTVPPHQINKAIVHGTVHEFWYILDGHGEIWRDDGSESSVTTLIPGIAIEISAGTAFQYRNVSDSDLKFLCITMPDWPGDSEVTFIEGKWQPTNS